MKYFITYGDDKFAKSRERMKAEACSLGLFDKTTVVTREDILKEKAIKDAMTDPEFAEVFMSEKGGGYWIWKPFVIFNELRKANEGDIVVYVDSGLTLKQSKKWDEYFDTVEKEGFIAFRQPFIEKDWTKGSVLDFFGALEDFSFTHTGQFSAGRLHVAKKCPKTMEAYSLWWHLAFLNPKLFDDSPSKNLEGFVEHRHDASVWSMICKEQEAYEDNDWEKVPVILQPRRRG